MKILLIFTLCLISDGGASKEVTGYSGGGILIKCKYGTEYRENTKYFCKGSSPGCSDQIKTGDKNQWVNSGRFSLYDDTKSSEFWVMIRNLTVQDTGMYQCVFVIPFGKRAYTLVELKVKNGAGATRYVTAYAGTRSNIKCRYEDQYKNKPKSFYRIETDQWSFNRIRTKLKSEWSHDGRFSIHDNRGAGFFSVFIRELITEDTGSYGCGVVVSDELEIFTVVKLNVGEGLSHEKSIIETVHVGKDMTVNCNYPESHRDDNKFLCKRIATAACSYTLTVKESGTNVQKGHFSLYDDREQHILTVSLRNVTEQDSGEFWCGAEVNWKSDDGYKVYFKRINLEVSGFSTFTVITVSVVLLLLLLGMMFLIVILHKRRKAQDSKTMTQNSREADGDHENNPNVLPLQSAQNANLSESVYQSLDPQTNLSDSVYQSFNPMSNQSDSVYGNVNF